MRKSWQALVLGFSIVMTAGPGARAAEFLVHDGVFTFDETGAHNHGFYYFASGAGAPANWSSPDDYFHGEFHLRFEVLSQATGRASRLQYCIWQDGGDRETCSPHVPLAGAGAVATRQSSPSTWWVLDDPVDFSRPGDFDRQGTPLWNDETCLVSDWPTENCWADRVDYFPFTARMTVVAVSAGSTFSGWETYIDDEPDPPAPTSAFPFTHHFIADSLQLGGGDGRFGPAALADFDRDGDLDFVVGNGMWEDHALWWFENRGRDDWVRHDAGELPDEYTSGIAFDVDRDGWMDIVTSNYWYRNSQAPATAGFERHQYNEQVAAHDVVVADMDGDGVEDFVQMYNDPLLFHWYERPADPLATESWVEHQIWGEAIHAGFGPGGVGDLDGDGDADVFRSDIWLENLGEGLEWASHPMPFGASAGPWGLGSRAVIVDIDADGDNDVVATECDMIFARAAVLYNVTGDGAEWAREDLPLTDAGDRGSLHSLQVADLDLDGDLDVFTVEQEDLRWLEGGAGLPTPRWFVWENTGEAFVEHVVFDGNLGGHEALVGDVDQDGDLDITSKVWLGYDGNANGGREHADFMENRLIDRLDNGRDLDGWTVHGGEFEVVDGAIQGSQADGYVGGLLLSDRQYGDFGIEFEAWPDWGVDTGVYLRTTLADLSAYQICIDYQEGNPMGGIYGAGFGTWDYWEGTWDFTVLDEDEIQGAPTHFELSEWSTIWHPGTWNRFRGRIEGNPPHIQVWINDRLVTDLVETELRHEPEGYIGLQVHDGEGEWPAGAVTRFRNLKVYDLSLFDRGMPGGPSIRITSPLPSATFAAGDDLEILAEASAGEGATVTAVAFFADDVLLAEDAAAPWAATWQNLTEGQHTVRARLSTSRGETAEASVSFSVSAGASDTIHLEAEEHDEGSGITINGPMIESCDDGDWIMFEGVNLGDGFNTFVAYLGRPGDTELTVEVHLDSAAGELIATLTPAGTGGWYTFEEQSTTVSSGAGIHDLYLTFHSGWGVANFDWFEFRDPNNRPPTVSLTSPADGAVFALGEAIEVEAVATDPDGEVTLVQVFVDGSEAAMAAAPPFAWTFDDVSLGTHTLSARAIDDDGARASSQAVTITVTEDGSDAGVDGGADAGVPGGDGGCDCAAAGRARRWGSELVRLFSI